MVSNLLKIFFLSMLPLTELRGSIPLAYGLYELNPVWVYVAAVLGNIVPVFFIWIFLEKLSGWFMKRSRLIEKILIFVFDRARKRFYAQHKKFGDIALMLFVAVPLPVTGAWTGAVAAWLFGIPYKRSVYLIFAGLLISGFIVSLLSYWAF